MYALKKEKSSDESLLQRTPVPARQKLQSLSFPDVEPSQSDRLRSRTISSACQPHPRPFYAERTYKIQSSYGNLRIWLGEKHKSMYMCRLTDSPKTLKIKSHPDRRKPVSLEVAFIFTSILERSSDPMCDTMPLQRDDNFRNFCSHIHSCLVKLSTRGARHPHMRARTDMARKSDSRSGVRITLGRLGLENGIFPMGVKIDVGVADMDRRIRRHGT